VVLHKCVTSYIFKHCLLLQNNKKTNKLVLRLFLVWQVIVIDFISLILICFIFTDLTLHKPVQSLHSHH